LFTITDHRVDQAEFILSPNFSDRPEGIKPTLLVIHNISLPPGEFGGPYIADFFQNKLDASKHPFFEEIANLQVSSHLLIGREGQLIQFVDLNKKAWHAGISEFEGQKECNDFSIGIELEGTDTEPYSDKQYLSLISLTNCLMESYSGISIERIVGHSDIAPSRKTDPGVSFDWSRYKDSLT
jgi:AmpD protein